MAQRRFSRAISDQHTARVCDLAQRPVQQQALLGFETLHLLPGDLHGGLGCLNALPVMAGPKATRAKVQAVYSGSCPA